VVCRWHCDIHAPAATFACRFLAVSCSPSIFLVLLCFPSMAPPSHRDRASDASLFITKRILSKDHKLWQQLFLLTIQYLTLRYSGFEFLLRVESSRLRTSLQNCATSWPLASTAARQALLGIVGGVCVLARRLAKRTRHTARHTAPRGSFLLHGSASLNGVPRTTFRRTRALPLPLPRRALAAHTAGFRKQPYPPAPALSEERLHSPQSSQRGLLLLLLPLLLLLLCSSWVPQASDEDDDDGGGG
jgi:hypothetical protein